MVADRLSKEEAEAERMIMDEINQQTKTQLDLEKVKQLEETKVIQETVDSKKTETDSETSNLDKNEVVESSLNSVVDKSLYLSSAPLSPSTLSNLNLNVDRMPETDPFVFDIVFNQKAKESAGVSIAACKVAYVNSSGKNESHVYICMYETYNISLI
jgi:hypothetical protein